MVILLKNLILKAIAVSSHTRYTQSKYEGRKNGIESKSEVNLEPPTPCCCHCSEECCHFCVGASDFIRRTRGRKKQSLYILTVTTAYHIGFIEHRLNSRRCHALVLSYLYLYIIYSWWNHQHYVACNILRSMFYKYSGKKFLSYDYKLPPDGCCVSK